ncbi:hypothetical protein HGRIS_010728 [Hohenbuehelia grisea]|uniref:Uncharacterized protein n=1 Tax=Hohenbuehelia grisea TaxID=104357 RepID=A0ABR3IXK5_9AGAR
MPFMSSLGSLTPTSTSPSTTSSTPASLPNTIPLGSNEAKLYISAIGIVFLGGLLMAFFIVRRLRYLRRMKSEEVEEKDLEKQGDGVKESAAKRMRSYLNTRWNIFSRWFTTATSEASTNHLRASLNERWAVFSGWFTSAVSGFLKKNSPPVQQEPPQPFKFRRKRRSSLVEFIYHLPRISPFRIEIEAWKQRLRESRDPIQYRWYINYEDVLMRHEEKLKAEAPMELYYLRIKLLRKLRIRKEKAERMGIVPEPAMPKGVSRAPSADLYAIIE